MAPSLKKALLERSKLEFRGLTHPRKHVSRTLILPFSEHNSRIYKQRSKPADICKKSISSTEVERTLESSIRSSEKCTAFFCDSITPAYNNSSRAKKVKMILKINNSNRYAGAAPAIFECSGQEWVWLGVRPRCATIVHIQIRDQILRKN